MKKNAPHEHAHKFESKVYREAQKTPKSAASYEKKLGPVEHDKPGYHNIRYGQHRLNIGAHRLEYTHKPCLNRKCSSYGRKHPNCKCHAKGGMIEHFCGEDNMHEGGCAYYYKGGEVKKGFNFANFKKTKEDKHTVTMAHPSGHELVIAKASVTPFQRKQLEKLPLHAAMGADIAANDDSSAPTDIPQDAAASSDMPQDKMIDYQESAPRDPSAQTVPTQSQTSKMPQPASILTQSSATPSGTEALNTGDIYQKELAGIKERQVAETGLAQSEAQIEKSRQQEIQQEQQNWLQTNAGLQKNISDALQDVKNGHINPNHYLQNMSVAGKISTAVGLLLGGFSGGLNKTGVNPAAQWLTSQINNDIEAQKVDLENKKTVYGGYLDQYKNAAVADQMARATQLGIYASKIREAGAKAGSPMAASNANIAAAELEQKIIPLVNNAHLIKAFSQFNGIEGNTAQQQGGKESQFKVALQAAQQQNPALYTDQQSRYVPGVGIASHAVNEADRERLANIDQLTPLIDKAIQHQKNYGYLGTNATSHPILNAADAANDEQQLVVQLNKLTGLNRLNDQEYKNYKSQVGAGEIGRVNLGGTLRTLENLKAQAVSDRNSAMTSMGITPFTDAMTPSGLTGQAAKNFNTFMKNNPKIDPGAAKDILKSKGMI